MRRYFFRISLDLAKKYGYQAIGTGESIGQVASQTLESMQIIQNVLDNFLIYRPLLTYDKIEIINLAKKYGTYDTSIQPFSDCCSLFVPINPVIKPNEVVAQKLETELIYLNKIYESVAKNIKWIKI
jgi:thiamine biosynthesis protein ThiI